MGRFVRLKTEAEAWYHVHSRTASRKAEYPLEKPLCRDQLIRLIQHYCSAYCCEVAAFTVMGNHYHLVVRFDEYREMENDELMQRALVLYPKSKKLLQEWNKEQWKRLNQRLFDLSELMRNIQAAFAKWYNLSFDRRGRFWADRFKSTLLESGQSVLDCVLYVDLNPVRGGLFSRPEEHQGTSIYFREIRKGSWLVSLKEIMGEAGSLKEYRSLLYYRGAVPSKEGQATIPRSIFNAEEARGFESSGVYRKRLRYFVDGLVLGSEGFVREHLVMLRKAGKYLRRKNPIKHVEGDSNTLREQRSHAVVF